MYSPLSTVWQMLRPVGGFFALILLARQQKSALCSRLAVSVLPDAGRKKNRATEIS
jgi:hypothetical protein